MNASVHAHVYMFDGARQILQYMYYVPVESVANLSKLRSGTSGSVLISDCICQQQLYYQSPYQVVTDLITINFEQVAADCTAQCSYTNSLLSNQGTKSMQTMHLPQVVTTDRTGGQSHPYS